MADTVEITAGSGTTIATDDAGAAGHVQIVKLAIATDGSATAIPADGTDGLLVNLGSNNDVVVSATNLDIRDLTSASDSVEAKQSTAANLKVEQSGAAKGATAVAAITATAAGADHNGMDVVLRDAVGNELDLRAENETWSAGDHGVLMFGRDVESVPNKYRAMALNTEGDIQCDLSDINGAEPNVGSGAASTGTLRVILATDQPVIPVSDNGGALTVDGTVTVSQGTAASLNCTEASAADIKTAVQLIDDTIFADDAAFTVGTSKVSAIGGLAVAHGSAPDAADAADIGIPLMNRNRVLFVIGGHPNVVTLEAEYTSAQTNAAIVSVDAGSKIVVTQIQALVSNATTATPQVRIGFAAATTPTTTGVVLTHGGIPGGGGVSRGDGSGILGIGADAEDLRITCDAPTGGGIRVLVSYYTIPS